MLSKNCLLYRVTQKKCYIRILGSNRFSSPILLFRRCFGTRKSNPFHLATSISLIQNQKYPKNAINACANTKFVHFSHHQFNTRLHYVHAVPFLVMKYLTMFFSWTVVFHLWGQFSRKGEKIQFSRYPPLSWITLWALPSNVSSALQMAVEKFVCSRMRLWHF